MPSAHFGVEYYCDLAEI